MHIVFLSLFAGPHALDWKDATLSFLFPLFIPTIYLNFRALAPYHFPRLSLRHIAACVWLRRS